MKKMAQLHRRPWFLWIGGACFLVGSLVAGSFSLASAGPTVSGTVVANQGTSGSSSWPVTASQSGKWQQEITDGTNVLGTPSNPLRTDPTGTTTQPVSGTIGLGAGSNDIGNVGISGSLPSGTNDIGTVHVASPSPTIVTAGCNVPDSGTDCTPVDTGMDTAGQVVDTISVRCTVKQGHHLEALFTAGASNFAVPLTLQLTIVGGTTDYYDGTLTNLNIPVAGVVGENTVYVQEDYVATSGDGAFCTFNFTTTTS